MSITIENWPVMPTRPCSFCLSLQGGSVFADFDANDARIVSLLRISFDGYGCCVLEESATKMSADDSKSLLDAIASGALETSEVEDLLKRFFRENSGLIWNDALEEQGLI